MITKSIKSKLIIIISVLLLVVSTGLGIISYIDASNALVSNIEKTLPQIATQASNTVQANLDSKINALELTAEVASLNNDSPEKLINILQI